MPCGKEDLTLLLFYVKITIIMLWVNKQAKDQFESVKLYYGLLENSEKKQANFYLERPIRTTSY